MKSSDLLTLLGWAICAVCKVFAGGGTWLTWPQYTIYTVIRALYNITLHPLAKYPGPKLFAAFVFPRYWIIWTGDHVATIHALQYVKSFLYTIYPCRPHKSCWIAERPLSSTKIDIELIRRPPRSRIATVLICSIAKSMAKLSASVPTHFYSTLPRLFEVLHPTSFWLICGLTNHRYLREISKEQERDTQRSRVLRPRPSTKSCRSWRWNTCATKTHFQLCL